MEGWKRGQDEIPNPGLTSKAMEAKCPEIYYHVKGFMGDEGSGESSSSSGSSYGSDEIYNMPSTGDPFSDFGGDYTSPDYPSLKESEQAVKKEKPKMSDAAPADYGGWDEPAAPADYGGWDERGDAGDDAPADAADADYGGWDESAAGEGWDNEYDWK